jgi:hypothetical protein
VLDRPHLRPHQLNPTFAFPARLVTFPENSPWKARAAKKPEGVRYSAPASTSAE